MRYWLGFAALVLIWGTQFLVIKVGQAHTPALVSVALRFTIVACVGQLLVWLTHARAPAGRGRARLTLGLTQSATMGLLYWAEGHLPSAIAAIVLATTPFFVAFLAHFLVPHERYSWRTLASTVLGFGGVTTLTWSRTSTSSLSAVACVAVLLAAGFSALNKVTAKRLTSSVPMPVLLRDMGAIVALVTIVCAFLLESPETWTPSAWAWLPAAYLGLVASALASGLYLVLLRRVPVTTVAYLQFLTTLVAMVTGIVLGKETFAAAALLGSALILLGLCITLGRKGDILLFLTTTAEVHRMTEK